MPRRRNRLHTSPPAFAEAKLRLRAGTSWGGRRAHARRVGALPKLIAPPGSACGRATLPIKGRDGVCCNGEEGRRV